MVTIELCSGKLGLGISNRSVDKFVKVDTITNINAVCSGSDHTLALDRDDNVWSVGNNSYGQLGLNDFEPRNIFTKTNLFDVLEITRGSYDSFFLDHTGTMWVCGRTIFGLLNLDNKSQKNLIQKSLTDVKSLMGAPITKHNKIKFAKQIL